MWNEPTTSARRRRRPYPALLFALAGGLILLVLAVPRTFVSVVTLPGLHVLNAIQNDAEFSREDLQVLSRGLERASAWIDSGRIETDQGLAQLRLARTAGYRSEEGRRFLDEAGESLRRGLARAPANPFAWARLAFVRLAKDGPSKAVTEALVMSMKTGADDPRLRFSRLPLFLSAWEWFDEDGRRMAEAQIRRAWMTSPRTTAEIARRHDRSEAVRGVLAAAPDDLKQFNALMVSP